MSNKSDSKTEQQEETVNLFAEGFDDKSILAPDEPAPQDQEITPAPQEAAPEDLPEKYKGKSLKDIIQMHQEVERAYGRGQNELGELRKLTDQILKQQLGEDQASGRKKLEAESLLEDPDAAIEGAVSANPTVRALEARLTARERAEQLASFNRKHPNAQALVTDPKFLKWVDESPTRARLLQQADQTFDYELASEIITMFEKANGASAEQREDDKAALGNAKPSAAGGSAGKVRYYKRSDLMRLKMENPDRYERLQPEILKAYAEGRVR